MGTFETVTLLMPDSTVMTDSRSTSTDNRPKAEKILLSGRRDILFDGRTCWIPKSASECLHIRMSDTTDLGVVDRLWTDDYWSVAYHDGSLWTYEVDHGEAWTYHEDVLSMFEWAEIGGTYQTHYEKP